MVDGVSASQHLGEEVDVRTKCHYYTSPHSLLPWQHRPAPLAGIPLALLSNPRRERGAQRENERGLHPRSKREKKKEIKREGKRDRERESRLPLTEPPVRRYPLFFLSDARIRFMARIRRHRRFSWRIRIRYKAAKWSVDGRGQRKAKREAATLVHPRGGWAKRTSSRVRIGRWRQVGDGREGWGGARAMQHEGGI